MKIVNEVTTITNVLSDLYGVPEEELDQKIAELEALQERSVLNQRDVQVVSYMEQILANFSSVENAQVVPLHGNEKNDFEIFFERYCRQMAALV